MSVFALGYRLSLALCLTKVRSSRARCPATAQKKNAHALENVIIISNFQTLHISQHVSGNTDIKLDLYFTPQVLNAPVICNHFVPTYRVGWGIAWLKCVAITFSLAP